MALVKQPIELSFAQGLNTKTDPYQVPLGQFLRLQNSVFDKYKRLTKRNGYGLLTALPTSASYITTFQGNLTSIGSSLQAYIEGANTWVNRGNLQPVSLNTLPLLRNNKAQTQVDACVNPAVNLVCTVYSEYNGSSYDYKYVLADSLTGQNVLAPAIIPSSTTILYAPKVFLLGPFFVIVFGTSTSIQYVAIPQGNPQAPVAATTLSAQFSGAAGGNFDGVVANNNLYVSFNGSDGGGAIRTTYLDSTLTQHVVKVQTGKNASLMSVCADTTGNTPVIFISFWDFNTDNGWTTVYDSQLNLTRAFTRIITGVTVANITSTAYQGTATIYYSRTNTYSYNSIQTRYLNSVTCTSGGTVGSATVLVRSLDLGSKAFLINGQSYVLGAYQSTNQSSYFLLNSSGQVLARLAYSNGGGYYSSGLPGVSLAGSTFYVGYLYADLLVAVAKTNTSTSSVYAQTGLNLASFTLGSMPQSVEIGSTLNLTGGFMWNYDGYSPVENNFFLWPEDVLVTTNPAGGSILAGTYYYVAVYEWTDNQGNIQRSAPSIPYTIVTAGSTSINTVKIPTLRLTYKTANPVKVVLYRQSVAQPIPYQITSITSPLLNDPSVDSVSFFDPNPDADYVGNSILYTFGGTVENITGPAFNALALFDARVWGIDAEDPNLLWYSKQVIENTPVEMSDVFTLFVAPSIGVQGSTGQTKCLFPMDDKLIIFKPEAMAYVNGSGPDNTGANSGYSEPTFIAATVGCSNQASIVLIPNGLMFQSDKGIWLLSRDLSTNYIGFPVEDYTKAATVQSAVSIPGTNQVRFTMSSGVTLMYDYFFNQWGTFINIPAANACIFQGLHTYVDTAGKIFQETPGAYLDGSSPVLQGFTTSWIAAAGLQGFQRLYFMNFLGQYISPHKLNCQIAYDYEPNSVQSVVITPDNYGGTWGNDTPVGNPGVWGGSATWGGGTTVEQERVFFSRQKCTSFQIIVDEVFDSSYGTVAGAGLTMSGLNLTIGVKKAYPTNPAARSFG